MLRNNLKIAFRNLALNKTYSAINLFGLATGMATALLTGLWIYDELSFDTYHQNYDRIAQVNYAAVEEGTPYVQTRQSYLLADLLKTDYGNDFSQLVMANSPGEYILSAGQTNITKTGLFIEAGGPQLFTLPMLKGSWSALQDPYSILLSASTAKALFGEADPLNRLVKINADQVVKITGVYDDLPQNTRFHEVTFFAPFDLYATMNPRVKEQGWANHSVYLYAQIQPAQTFKQVSTHIKDALLGAMKKLEGMQERIAQQPQLFLLPMKDWHLYSQFKEGVPDPGPVRFVWMIGLIGLSVLLLACINFINLSTARSEKRAREVGIRKAMGSQRTQLISQFLSESLLVTLLAFGVALLLTLILLPWFNDMTAKAMTIPWTNAYYWLISLGFIGLTSLLAGSYPALYLSSSRSLC